MTTPEDERRHLGDEQGYSEDEQSYSGDDQSHPGDEQSRPENEQRYPEDQKRYIDMVELMDPQMHRVLATAPAKFAIAKIHVEAVTDCLALILEIAKSREESAGLYHEMAAQDRLLVTAHKLRSACEMLLRALQRLAHFPRYIDSMEIEPPESWNLNVAIESHLESVERRFAEAKIEVLAAMRFLDFNVTFPAYIMP